MGEFETPASLIFVPSNPTIVDDWRSNGNIVALVTALRLDALTFNVLQRRPL